jgi:hypothetical protein
MHAMVRHNSYRNFKVEHRCLRGHATILLQLGFLTALDHDKCNVIRGKCLMENTAEFVR